MGKGLARNKSIDYGRRGAAPARRDFDDILPVFREIATPLERMHRRPERTTCFVPGPKGCVKARWSAAILCLGCGEPVSLGTVGAQDARDAVDDGNHADTTTMDSSDERETPAAQRPIGGACSTPDDCAAMESMCLTQLSFLGDLVDIPFPGGYCTRPCELLSNDCGDGASCFFDPRGNGFCLDTCSADTECRQVEGYHCGPIPGTDLSRYCLPPLF